MIAHVVLRATDLVATIQARFATMRDDQEAGLSTLEIVIIALGLFLLAGLLVAGITAAVNSRLGQIS